MQARRESEPQCCRIVPYGRARCGQVHDQELGGAPDEQVFEVSVREGRTLVTLDRDLGQVLRFPPGSSAGMIVIYPGSRMSHRGLLQRTRKLLALLETHSPDRALWIVEPGRVRIHAANGEE
ncbi:MAG TPA: DUF5615 family PIN-like protein [Stellaceae bacterium]|nr:DUF5615 family PIN-like protein [Stellaceae bacterium]